MGGERTWECGRDKKGRDGGGRQVQKGKQIPPRGGGYSHTLPIRVCATQRGCDFEAPDLERGIHFRGVF